MELGRFFSIIRYVRMNIFRRDQHLTADYQIIGMTDFNMPIITTIVKLYASMIS